MLSAEEREQIIRALQEWAEVAPDELEKTRLMARRFLE